MAAHTLSVRLQLQTALFPNTGDQQIIERTVKFRLLECGIAQSDTLPGTHPGVYREAASAGIFSESIADDLANLWSEH